MPWDRIRAWTSSERDTESIYHLILQKFNGLKFIDTTDLAGIPAAPFVSSGVLLDRRLGTLFGLRWHQRSWTVGAWTVENAFIVVDESPGL